MPLCWVDIETTGLNVDHDVILEVGIMVTSSQLDFIDARSFIIEQPAAVIACMEPWCKTTHAKSGLLDLIPAGVTLPQASAMLVDFMRKHFEKSPPMCGLSVHFDRSFLQRHMPELEGRFSYRNIDVQSIKELVNKWAPHVATDPARPKGRHVHRALPDLEDSIDEAKFYKAKLFDIA